MTSTIKVSEYCKRQLANEPTSYDKEVFTMLSLLTTEPCNIGPLMEIGNKMLNDYQKLNTLTHMSNKKNTLIPEIISNDARYPEFVKNVEQAYKNLQEIINEIKEGLIKDKLFIDNLTELIACTNKISKSRDLKDVVLSIPYKPRQLGFFNKILLALGIASSLGATSIRNKDTEVLISNKTNNSGIKSDMEIYQPEINMRMDADNISYEQAKNIVLTQKLKKTKEERRREEEKAKAFKIEYKQVLRSRKNVIARVDAALRRSQMPTDYLIPKDIKALIYQESRFNPEIVSKAGAYGLMQVMDASSDMSIEDNIAVGLKILKEKDAYCRQYYKDWDNMNQQQKKDILFAIYNCGQGTWESNGSSLTTAPTETQKHIEFIHNYQKYSS